MSDDNENENKKSPAWWLVIGAVLVILVSIWFGWYVEKFPVRPVNELLPPWWAGLGSIVSGFVACYAAWLLSGTLKETKAATEVMRRQLRQMQVQMRSNRAYLIIGYPSFSRTSIMLAKMPEPAVIKAVICNAGVSPALNVLAVARIGIASSGYESSLEEFPYTDEIPRTVAATYSVNVSVNLTASLANEALLISNGLVYVQFAAKYSDIYGVTYITEHTELIQLRPFDEAKSAILVERHGNGTKSPTLRYPVDRKRNSERIISGD